MASGTESLDTSGRGTDFSRVVDEDDSLTHHGKKYRALGARVTDFLNRIPFIVKLAIIVVVLGSVVAIIAGIVYAVDHKSNLHASHGSRYVSKRCLEVRDKLLKEVNNTLAYDRVAYIATMFGARLSGTPTLENTIDWIQTTLQSDGFENVTTDPVQVPVWVRGNEYASLLQPKARPMAMLGLGMSVGGNVTAEVLVVSSFADLAANSSRAAGKIVLFNAPFVSYGSTVAYRISGASVAAAAGAVGCLVRSVTPFSLYTPHTGTLEYQGNVTQIPAAAITLEDADLLAAWQAANQTVVVQLYMEAQLLPNTSLSRNVMGQINGARHPEKLVVMGGHTDSWDVGQGAMDDGGGVAVTWEAVRLLIAHGFRPARSIRFVGWTNEENGANGAATYAQLHADEVNNTILALESDIGTQRPLGIEFAGSNREAKKMVKEIAKLFEPIAPNGTMWGGGGTDIDPLVQMGVPGSSLWVDNAVFNPAAPLNVPYFWLHHTNADTIDKIDPVSIGKCAVTLAIFSFCVADAELELPR